MRSMETMVAVILGGLLLAGVPAGAGESYWGTSTGNFSADGSWESGGVPGVGDNANFANNASYTVNFTADDACDNANFSAAGGAVTLDTTDSYGWTLSGGVTLADTMTLNLKRGELTTSGDSTLNYATIFELGNAAANPVETFTWNITGGTTKFISAGESSESANYLGIGKTDQRGQGILNISGAGTVVSNNNWVHIGRYNWNSPGCQINISGGAKMYTAGNSYIGWSCNNNRVVVDGAGSQWTVTSAATGKGSGSYNTLIVTNGGSIVGGVASGVEGDNNEVIITGTGSSVIGAGINVGLWFGADNNTLTVADGASCYVSSGNCGLGKDQSGANPATQSNTVHVTGAGSTLTATNSNFYISGSNSSFRVTEGGFANLKQWNGDGTLGGAWTVIEVSDPGSELSIGSCRLGASGSINVTNGGAFVSRGGNVYFGQTSGAEASVLVSGSGSTFSSTGLPFRVASVSDARITVADGGVFDHRDLTSDWGVSIGYAAGETGTVVVTGSDSVFRFTDVDNGGGSVRVGDGGVGILTVANGGLVEDGHAVIGAGSGSTGTATISGGGSVWTNTGYLTVGRSANDSTATLAFELDANGAGTVYVDGTMTIYPTQSYLTVDLSNYHWEQGTEFVLVDCGTLSTAFDAGNISITGLNGGTITQDEGNNNQIILTVNGPQGTVISVK